MPRILARTNNVHRPSVATHTTPEGESKHHPESAFRDSTSLNPPDRSTRPSLSTLGHSRKSSTTSGRSSSYTFDGSYFGLPKEEALDYESITPESFYSDSSRAMTIVPLTPTSINTFDLEAQIQTPSTIDSDAITPVNDATISEDKPLPLPPLPSIPPPAVRPAGPRQQPSSTSVPIPLLSSQVFSMRTHKVRYEPRSVLPLACIPELHSNPNSQSSTPGAGAVPDSTPTRPSINTRPSNHERTRNSPSTKTPSSGDSPYGNIAPWDACPCPGAQTYSFEILGGPRALDASERRAMGMREKKRRERESNGRRGRIDDEKSRNEGRGRPKGPRLPFRADG
jgi:hypothetical protein